MLYLLFIRVDCCVFSLCHSVQLSSSQPTSICLFPSDSPRHPTGEGEGEREKMHGSLLQIEAKPQQSLHTWNTLLILITPVRTRLVCSREEFPHGDMFHASHRATFSNPGTLFRLLLGLLELGGGGALRLMIWTDRSMLADRPTPAFPSSPFFGGKWAPQGVGRRTRGG